MKWILALIFLSSSAWAQSAPSYTTGGDLRENCGAALEKQTQSGARAGLCLGFLDAYRQLSVMAPAVNLSVPACRSWGNAVNQSDRSMPRSSPGTSPPSCIPTELRRDQRCFSIPAAAK
jgi:hypothetical protein